MSEKWLWYIPLTQSALAGDNTCRAYGLLTTDFQFFQIFSSFKRANTAKDTIWTACSVPKGVEQKHT